MGAELFPGGEAHAPSLPWKLTNFLQTLRSCAILRAPVTVVRWHGR